MTRPVRREGRAASLRRLSVFSHAKGGALGRLGSIVPVLVPVLILVRGAAERAQYEPAAKPHHKLMHVAAPSVLLRLPRKGAGKTEERRAPRKLAAEPPPPSESFELSGPKGRSILRTLPFKLESGNSRDICKEDLWVNIFLLSIVLIFIWENRSAISAWEAAVPGMNR